MAEISFWSNLRSLEGISVCCALVELFHSVVAVLYVVEVQTAFIFTLTAFVGLAVAIWKMTKIFDTKVCFIPLFQNGAITVAGISLS